MKKLFLLLGAAVTLSACGGLLSKKAPDELAVIEGPALAIPPHYELRPPREGEAVSYESARDTRALLLGDNTQREAYEGDADNSWLLERAGGEKRDPRIREKLMQEAMQKEARAKERENSGFFGGLFGGSDTE